MLDTTAHFDRLYKTEAAAFGWEADSELMCAVAGLAGGRIVDLGGGQGRHCLPLARMGFEVEVVDCSEPALRQVLAEAALERLDVSGACVDVAAYVPPSDVAAVIAALLFHLPAPHRSLRVAECLGAVLRPGGLFYLSLPGYDRDRVRFAGKLLEAAGCSLDRIVNHIVTRGERPRLPVPRRNETRGFGFKR
jgi:2-polyprenyl-3-methyl-5-hydroxy-6-metoxy-1,4-benzoquinol methylase